MARFIIEPHMRLHEWVAVEKGYFDDVIMNYQKNLQRKTLKQTI